MKDPHLHYLKPQVETPFHDRIAALNVANDWAPWAGYQAANTLQDLEMEYTAVRSQASLYDLSPMVKYRVEGPEAEAYLNRLTVRDVRKLKPGMVHYTVWCDDAGKVLDDATLFRLSDQRYMICCQERHLPWLTDSALGFDVRVTEDSVNIAALSLQGPCSYAVLKAAGFGAAVELRNFRLKDYDHPKIGKVTISRTGFTGDLGYELWTTPKQALALFDALMAAGKVYGLRVIGSAALNMARIEAGFIITNMDFIPADQALRPDRVRSPYEIGLGWLVDLNKGHFNGRRALLAEQANGTAKHALIGLEIDGNISAEGSIVYHDKEKEVGIITAACWSPTLKRNIAIASMTRPYEAAKNGNLWVEIYALRELHYHKLMMKAKVVDRPFFNPERKRAFPPGEW
jgi:aminomethyltransferase